MQVWELERCLNRAWGAEKEIQRLEETYREAFERLTSTTGNPDAIAVKASLDPHKFDGLAALESRVREKIDRKAAIQAEVIDAIDLLEEQRFRAILIDRYVLQMKWEGKDGIEGKENYSRTHVFRLHRQALAALAKKLSAEWD